MEVSGGGAAGGGRMGGGVLYFYVCVVYSTIYLCKDITKLTKLFRIHFRFIRNPCFHDFSHVLAVKLPKENKGRMVKQMNLKP